MKKLVWAMAFLAGCACEVKQEYAAKAPETAFRLADAIVVTKSATAKTKFGAIWYRVAAADLTNALARATGGRFAIYEEGTEPQDAKAAIYLGETDAAKAAGVTGEGMRNGDWRVKTVPGKAFLFGKTGMGAAHAVYEFLERYCDWHAYSPYAEPVMGANAETVVPCGDVKMAPVLYQRSIYHAMNNGYKSPTLKPMWERWAHRNKADPTDEYEGERCVSRGPGGCHTIHNYLPPEKYFKDHPEYFSMGPDGKRKGIRNAQSQICYTNPDVREIVYSSLVEFVEKEMKNENPALIFDMTQMDNSDFLCLCPECRKVIAKYTRGKIGGREEHWCGGDAGLQLEFANDIARRIAKKYPKVKIRVFAYVSSECAPKPGTIKPEPNVVIWWCDVYSYSCHLYPLEMPGHFNAHQAEEVRDWLKLTKNMQVWDYMLGDEVEVGVDGIAADAKFFAANGLPSIFMEMEYHEQPFHFLNYYLLSALYADPTKDVDALIHGFCRVYGGGAAEMEAAIGEIRRMQNAEPVADKQEWHQRRLKWITAANYEKLADLFERAYAKAGSENARLHVLLPLKKTWKDLVGIYKKDPFAEAKYKLAQEKYLHFGKEWAKTGFIENTTRAKREADVQDDIDLLTLRFTDLPEELKDVPAKDVVCIDYHGLDHKSPDPKAFRGMCNPTREDDASVKLPFSCGVYDWNSKESFGFTVTPEMLKQDGNYHWVKLGKIYVGRNSGFWYPGSWRSRANLRPHHVLADGLKEDPNWCELWVSFKVDGPKFVPGSKECDMIAVDRLALRRIKK